jgi:hypothetical protein
MIVDAQSARVRAFAMALRKELGSTHRVINSAMRWTGAGERAVKYWFAGGRGPSGDHLIAFARNSDVRRAKEEGG